MAADAAVEVQITFRTHYNTNWGESVAVVGNFLEPGNVLEGRLDWKMAGIWEKELSITMHRDERGNLTVPGENNLSFGFVLCNDNGQVLDDENIVRSIPLNANEILLEIEANWGNREFRVFPASPSNKVKIRIRIEHNTRREDEMVVLGNCLALGDSQRVADNELLCIKRGNENSTWEREISLLMVKDGDDWKLPAIGGGFEPLILKLSLVQGRNFLPGFAFNPKLSTKFSEDFKENKFELQCTFDGYCWVSIRTRQEYNDVRQESTRDLLHHTLDVHLVHHFASEIIDEVHKYLLPNIKLLNGGYDGRTMEGEQRVGTSGAPHRHHDIWGARLDDELVVPEDNIHPAAKSAMEYFTKKNNLQRHNVDNLAKVFKRLETKYLERQGRGVNGIVPENIAERNVAQLVEDEEIFPGHDVDFLRQPNIPAPEYKSKLINLAHLVGQREQNPNEHPYLRQLLRHSGAIVRGRMEALLVNEERDFMHSDWYLWWRNHLEETACWFVVMMAAMQQLGVIQVPTVRTELTEDGQPFIPNFYLWTYPEED